MVSFQSGQRIPNFNAHERLTICNALTGLEKNHIKNINFYWNQQYATRAQGTGNYESLNSYTLTYNEHGTNTIKVKD